MIEAIATWGGPLVGILGALIGAIALFFGGKRIGSAEAQSRIAEQKAKDAVAAAEHVAEQTIKTTGEVSRVQSEVTRADPGVAADRLRQDWNRDHPKR